eukprot:1138187-Pelagomonas_calceolata.AAC.5
MSTRNEPCSPSLRASQQSEGSVVSIHERSLAWGEKKKEKKKEKKGNYVERGKGLKFCPMHVQEFGGCAAPANHHLSEYVEHTVQWKPLEEASAGQLPPKKQVQIVRIWSLSVQGWGHPAK